MEYRNNVESLLGQIAMKTFYTNLIGCNSNGLPVPGMRDKPEAFFEIFFRQPKLTVFTGKRDLDGHRMVEEITCDYGKEIKEETLCRMIDKLNEVADIRRREFSKIVMERNYERVSES